MARRVAIVRAETARGSSALRVTARQSEILDRIASGLPDKEIARQLGISRRTVRTHIERLFSTYGLHDRAAAAVLWVRMNG
jgi:DNA-binding NarL/FixJ family response regulator